MTLRNSGETHHIWKRHPNGPELVLESSDLESPAGVVRDTQALDEFPASLSEHEADLLDIATAVFGTDRLAPRPSGSPDTHEFAHSMDWRRTILVQIPVRDASFWIESRITSSITNVLEELTDDKWLLEFVESSPVKRKLVQKRFPAAHDQPAALFSGGLDSLAGTLLYAVSHKQVPCLVSISSNSQVTHQQRALIGALRKRFSDVPEHLVLQVHNKTTRGKKTSDLAKRQRARSFLYYVVAALVARRMRSNSILVFENGITSLNLPISPLLTSTRATRTTHPLVLFAFEKMVRLVLQWDSFEILSPHLHDTKAEMVARIADAHYLIEQTTSCARMRMMNKWCGTCTACILRRQVFWAANLPELDLREREKYREDIFHSFMDESIPTDRRWYFLATLDHVGKLLRDHGHLATEPSLIRVAHEIALRKDTDSGRELSCLVNMHLRYAREWLNVLSHAQERYSLFRGVRLSMQHVAREMP